MKRILDFLVLAAFFGIPYGLIKLIITRTNPSWIMDIIFGLFLSGFLAGISYKKIWGFGIFRNTWSGVLFLLSWATLVFIIAYFSYAEGRSRDFYKYIVSENRRGWSGQVHQADDTLGLKPIPNAVAFHKMPFGPDIPMRYNNLGFRVPAGDSISYDYSNGVDILFLGCSFTYGDACPAEGTFPHLVAVKNNFSYINAGVCSYGLAQMLILAERLIPRHRPKYVVLQYSPWLAERSTGLYAPSYIGRLPAPYFIKAKSGFTLRYPVFESQVFSFDIELLRKNYSGRYLSFLFQEGLPFIIKEHWYKLKVNLWLFTGKVPKPSKEKTEIEKFAYARICEVAKKHGAKPIILNLRNKYPARSHAISNDVRFAEADSLLFAYLKTSASKDYSKEFHHWRFNGKDSVVVDGHPNLPAHKIIAESINIKLD